MKSMSTMAVAAALALTGAGFASAATPATIYHVSGSTAYRVADVSAEVNYLIASHGGATAAYVSSSTSLTGASTSVIASNDGQIIFENAFNGSILGDESVSGVTVSGNGNKIAFPILPSGTLAAATQATTTAPAAGGTPVASFATEAATYADIAFSDVSFATAQKIMAKANPSTTPAANNGGTVGIVPFVFVANTTSDVTDFGTNTGTTTIVGTSTITSANVTVAVSVTPQSFSNLWGAGAIAGGIFTGVTADNSVTVMALGRDIDSGTRATALAETGYGLKGSGATAVTTAMQQQYPLDGVSPTPNIVGNAGNGPIESFETVPATSVDGIPLPAGNSGYGSGGNLAKALSTTIDAGANPQTVLISYLGMSDAFTALTASGTNRVAAKLLAYNGSSFNPAGSTTAQGFATSADLAKIYNGQYTYWGFEHVYYNSNNAGTSGNANSANPNTIVGNLITELNTDNIDVLSSAGVHAASMIVSRTDDGLLVD